MKLFQSAMNDFSGSVIAILVQVVDAAALILDQWLFWVDRRLMAGLQGYQFRCSSNEEDSVATRVVMKGIVLIYNDLGYNSNNQSVEVVLWA
jgi:hypothetical protein